MKRLILLLLTSVVTIFIYSQRIQRSENGLYGIAVTRSNGSVKWVTKPTYTDIRNNFNGTFSVCDKNNKWGIITNAGKQVVACQYASEANALEAYKYYQDPSSKKFASNSSGVQNSAFADFTLTRDYSAYIKSYVEDKINTWQKKGEFEKSSDYQKRVTETSRKQKVVSLTKEVCDKCLQGVKDKELRMHLGEYDADHESFLVDTEIGQFVVAVPLKNAPDFKKNWPKIVSENTYDIVNGKIILRSANFSLNGKKVASYNDQNHALYAQANIEYNFDPIEVSLSSEREIRQPNIVQTNIQVGKSDVDINIPTTGVNNALTFALIIANEKYREESNVDFAHNDGNAIEKYFMNTLGIPQTNIHFVRDATRNDMIREIDWLKNIASVYNENINLLVYYAGHGVPNESDGSAYLIPIDGVGSNPKTLYSLSEFYDDLGSLKTKSTILFMDACFSGALRGGGMLASARGIALKAKEEAPKSNMVVISAATGDETAWPYRDKGHGLFTYFLLKKLQSSKGSVSLGQLAEYIKDEVGKYSVVANSKKQTPTISVSPTLETIWQSIKLR